MIIGKNINLRPLQVSDAEFILSIRLNPELSQYLNPVENDLAKQQEWIKNCINDPREEYFIIQNKNNERVGTIRIYNTRGKIFCWGSFIVLPEARSYASVEALVLLYDHAFFTRGFEQTDFDVRKKNDKALQFYLRFGATITHEDEQDFFMRYTKSQFSEKREEYNAVIQSQFQKNFPLVSIIILTYNHKKYVESALQNALAQNYPHIEIILADDASTDNTVAIIKKYMEKYPDKIILLQQAKNVGAAQNWFDAVAKCQGKYITCVSGDDGIPPHKVSAQVAVMEKDPTIAICYTDAMVRDIKTQKDLYRISDKSPTLSGNLRTALADSLYYSPTLMFQRQFAPPKNLFEGIRHANDLAYFKTVMIQSAPHGKIVYLPEILYFYQKHDANLTITRTNENYKEHIRSIKILQEKYPSYKKDLNPAIYDFCCVGFFKNIARGKLTEAWHFLRVGLSAAHYNPFKFLRALGWGIKFFTVKKLLRN